MALSPMQVKEVIDLCANNFVQEKDCLKRKRLLQRFDDTFGRGIHNWKDILLEAITEKDPNGASKEIYSELVNSVSKNDGNFDYRELCEADLPMVRELINRAFGFFLTDRDDDQLKKFINGYSFVACNKEDVLGISLAYVIPGLMSDKLYIDTLVVSEAARGQGIARHLIEVQQNKGYKNRIYSTYLMTDRQLEAYQLYQHLGFRESKYAFMSK